MLVNYYICIRMDIIKSNESKNKQRLDNSHTTKRKLVVYDYYVCISQTSVDLEGMAVLLED